MIDPADVLVRMVLVGNVRNVALQSARTSRERHLLQRRQCLSGEFTSRNNVSGVRRLRNRIHNLGGDFGKVAVAHLLAQHGFDARNLHFIAQRFPTKHEERLVAAVVELRIQTGPLNCTPYWVWRSGGFFAP